MSPAVVGVPSATFEASRLSERPERARLIKIAVETRRGNFEGGRKTEIGAGAAAQRREQRHIILSCRREGD